MDLVDVLDCESPGEIGGPSSLRAFLSTLLIELGLARDISG